MNAAQTISSYHPIMHSIALKMVGSIHDAEDIVQDTFLKWLTVDQSKIRNTKSYLIRSLINNCINHLNSLKQKKGELIDTLSPGALISRYKESDFHKMDLDHELAAALKVVHKKLEPIERTIYLLREVFQFDYEDLQDIVNRKKENCRQLFSRAKEKLSRETQKPKKSQDETSILESFKKASRIGHFSDLISSLTHEIGRI